MEISRHKIKIKFYNFEVKRKLKFQKIFYFLSVNISNIIAYIIIKVVIDFSKK